MMPDRFSPSSGRIELMREALTPQRDSGESATYRRGRPCASRAAVAVAQRGAWWDHAPLPVDDTAIVLSSRARFPLVSVAASPDPGASQRLFATSAARHALEDNDIYGHVTTWSYYVVLVP